MDTDYKQLWMYEYHWPTAKRVLRPVATVASAF